MYLNVQNIQKENVHKHQQRNVSGTGGRQDWRQIDLRSLSGRSRKTKHKMLFYNVKEAVQVTDIKNLANYFTVFGEAV